MTDDRLHAVLIEPQLARFRTQFELDGEPLTADFSGFHRHAICSRDRVFLFPRHREHVRGLLTEAKVLSALDGHDIPAARVHGVWRDDDISPYPFLCLERLPGSPWGKLEASATLDGVRTMLRTLGRTIATWHRIEPPLGRRIRASAAFSATVRIDALRDLAERATSAIGLPGRTEAWLRTLEPLARMRPVFTHGDVHEDQIMVDDELRITGVLDWEHASIGHPLRDFDFGEWGAGIFAWEDDFDSLRRIMWESYAEARGGELPPWYAVHLFGCATQLLHMTGSSDWDRKRWATNARLLREVDRAIAS